MAESGNFLDKVAASDGNLDLKGQLTSAAKNALPGAAGDIVDKVASNEVVSGAISKVEGMVQEGLKAIQSAAGGILGSSLGQISGLFPNGVGDIFSAINPTAGPLSTFAGDLTKGKKETDSMLKSFGADSAEAIANPVAFITKPVNDVIRGVDTVVQGGINTATPELSATVMDNLSKASGMNVTDNASANKATYSITNSMATRANARYGNTSKSFVEPTVSTSQSYMSTLLGGLIATMASSTWSPMSSNSLGMTDPVLPATYQNMLAKNSTSAVKNVATGYLTKKTQNIQNAQKKFNGKIDTGAITQTILRFGGDYPLTTTPSGQSTASTFGNNSQENIDLFYKVAKSICNGIQVPQSYAMSQNKDLFDLLLALCAQLGLTDLLKQLIECGHNIQDLFDGRSTNLLKDYLTTAAVNGSVYMVEAIVEGIGSYSVSNPKQTMMILNANMAEDSQSLTAYENLSSTLKTTPKGIVTENIGSQAVYNSDKVMMMASTNTTVIDNAIGANTRKLSTAAKSTYSKSTTNNIKKASLYKPNAIKKASTSANAIANATTGLTSINSIRRAA